MPEKTTAGVVAKAGLVLAWVPKKQVVGIEAHKVPWVMLPKAGWPGAEVVACAGDRAACFPPLGPSGPPERTA